MGNFDTLSGLVVRATTDRLGQAVTYTPNGGSGESVDGIWFDDAEDIQVGEGVPIIQPATFVDFRIADLSQTPAKGDTVTKGSTTYTIEEVRPTAQGAARCKVLRRS